MNANDNEEKDACDHKNIFLLSDEVKLKLILSEYDNLRGELLQKFNAHMQIFTIFFTLISAFLSIILIYKLYYLVYILTLASLPLILRYLWEQYVILIINNYLMNHLIEDRLKNIIGTRKESGQDEHWIGWMHFWDQERRKHRLSLITIAISFLFVSIPFIPSFIYAVGILLNYWPPVYISKILSTLISIVYLIMYALILGKGWSMYNYANSQISNSKIASSPKSNITKKNDNDDQTCKTSIKPRMPQ